MVLAEDIEPMIGFDLWNIANDTLDNLFCISIASNDLAAAGSILSIILANFGNGNGVLVGV